MRAPVPTATVTIAGERYLATEEHPVVFGRADAEGVAGLDPRDMGISGEAGSIEWKGMWFVVNRSRKRRLTIDEVDGSAHTLECGHRYPVNVSPLGVRVQGEILTHSISVVVPEAELAKVSCRGASTGTVLGGINLTTQERCATVALAEGYLLPPLRRQAWPRTSAQAAARLGPPWTGTSLRKNVEHLRTRVRTNGLFFEGPRATIDLIEHLIATRVIGPDDLRLLDP